MTRTEKLGIIIAVLTALVFGFYPVGTRGAYADGANATFVILLSAFGRASAMLAFCAITKRRILTTRDNIKRAVTNGFFQTLSVIGILGGMAYLPGPIAITTVFSFVTMLYLYGIFRGEEPFSIPTFACILAALFGLTLALDIYHQNASFSLAGIGLVSMAAVATATRMYMYGKQLKSADPITLGAETFLFVFVFCLLLLLYKAPAPPEHLSGWLWAVLGTVTVTIGNFGMFYSISMIGGLRFGFTSKLEPVFGAIFAALMIGEVLHPLQYAGIALVVGSLLFYQLVQNKR